MKETTKSIFGAVLLVLAFAMMVAGQNVKSESVERDFQRFDGNQSGWLSGRELIECQCKEYDKDGDNEVTKAEFFAGRSAILSANKAKADTTQVPANGFKVGDRVEADPLLIGNWRKGRVSQVFFTDTGKVNVYEIKFDAGEAMLVRADSNAMHAIAGGEVDETVAATSEPEFSLTATQMHDDYNNNEVAAKRKYVGKVVKVSGKIFIMNYSEMVRSYVALTARGYESAVTCYVVDREQLASLNRDETISIVGTVSGAYTGSASISLEPCKVVPTEVGARAVESIAPANRIKDQPQRKGGGVVAHWYYIAMINADGTETPLTNRQSSLDLKSDGTFEHDFGGYGGIGTYSVNGNTLRLNLENKAPRSYTMTFGEDGKKTFGLSGSTLSLINQDGVGYKLEK